MQPTLSSGEQDTGKFGFIKRVDKDRITTVNDLESFSGFLETRNLFTEQDTVGCTLRP